MQYLSLLKIEATSPSPKFLTKTGTFTIKTRCKPHFEKVSKLSPNLQTSENFKSSGGGFLYITATKNAFWP